MSTNLETNHLNLAGQVTLGSIASLCVNSVVHPIGTIKNRIMAGHGHKIALFDLYNGYVAACGVDAASLAIAYAINDILREETSPFWSAVGAGLISSPSTAIGEALMANRQVHALPYHKVIGKSLRPNGLVMTALREVPFTTAVFYASPLLQKNLQKAECSASTEFFLQVVTGIAAGSVAGAITAPIDLIKTRVQTSHQPLSIPAAIQSVLAKEGWQGLAHGSGTRALYIGAASAAMNVVNNAIPPLFPHALKTQTMIEE